MVKNIFVVFDNEHDLRGFESLVSAQSYMEIKKTNHNLEHGHNFHIRIITVEMIGHSDG